MSETKARGRERVGAGRATLADVAALAGVSTSAVSRTFTTGASVSEATRAKVVEAASALRYRPNLAARSLMINRSQVVGVAITALDNQYYPAFLQALSERFAKIGYRLLLFITHGELDLDPVLDEILQYRVDALVLASSSLSSRLARECRAAGVPAVMVNNVDPDCGAPCVVGDNVAGARHVAAFLAAGGHQRFAFVGGVDSASTSRDRERGYAEGLSALGLGAPMRAPSDYSFDGACAAARALLSEPRRPDAIFCANDHLAMAVLQTARAEFGLTPGSDLSIVGFDDAAISAWPGFDLTTFSQPVDAMASKIVDIVQRQIEQGETAAVQHVIPGRLVVRGSARIPSPRV